MAAANDFADAALRLGCVLDTLADQRASSPHAEYYTSQREELSLVSHAARWYAEAYGAGHPEAAERLGRMIGRHTTPATPATPRSATQPQYPSPHHHLANAAAWTRSSTTATSQQLPPTSVTAPPASANSSAAADC